MAEKLLYIVGGPNGAGKTSAANEMLRSSAVQYEYIGADLIAAQLSPDNPSAAILEAGRVFYRRIAQCFTEGRNCIVESTLAGKSLRRIVESARALGYRVHLRFVFIDSAGLSCARVRQRVAKGGHDVQDDDIRRRFPRTFRNFWSIYRDLAHDWVITYNGAVGGRIVAFGDSQHQIVVNDALFAQFLAIAESDDAHA